MTKNFIFYEYLIEKWTLWHDDETMESPFFCTYDKTIEELFSKVKSI